MSGFAIRNPYFIVVICLIIAVVGVTSLVRMPVDMFPAMNIPVVVVATFYSGMPPEQLETDIIGLLPMALKLGAGSESYAPLARAVLGRMSVSLMMTVIMVPAAYYVAYRKDDLRQTGEVY